MAWICLMYHDVLPSTRARGGGSEHFAVPLSSFETMLDTIVATERLGCSVSETLRGGGPRVAISFDDGTSSQLEHAVPALQARGMTATFFVTTDWIGTSGFMSWSELKDLASEGMSIQSHTKSHPFLAELHEDQVRAELTESKEALDRQLGQITDQISLPGGNAPSAGVRHLFRESGYRIVAGSRWGTNPHPYEPQERLVRRCNMRGVITRTQARRVLDGDPWLKISRYAKEATLNGVRATLGPSRYARWRRRILDRWSAPQIK